MMLPTASDDHMASKHSILASSGSSSSRNRVSSWRAAPALVLRRSRRKSLQRSLERTLFHTELEKLFDDTEQEFCACRRPLNKRSYIRSYHEDDDDDTSDLSCPSDNICDEKEQEEQKDLACAKASTTTGPETDDGRKSVQFSTVTIFYHNTILGDSPSVSDGAPLALGEVRLDQETYPVEQEIAEDNANTRVQQTAIKEEHLILSAVQRKEILIKAGVSRSAMKRWIQFHELDRKDSSMAAMLYPDLATRKFCF